MRLVTKNYKGIDHTEGNSNYYKDYISKETQKNIETEDRINKLKQLRNQLNINGNRNNVSTALLQNIDDAIATNEYFKTLSSTGKKQYVQDLVNKVPDSFSKGFINTSALDDGFDWYDPLAMIGATTADITLDVLQGGLNAFEGMKDTGQYLLADIAEWGFGNKNTIANTMNPGQENWANSLANDLRKEADFDFTSALMGKSQNPENNFFGNWQEELEYYSAAGNKLDQINNSIGQIGSYALTGNVLGNSKPLNAMVTFTSSYGNAKSQAKRNGASEEDAIKTALVSATAETISENLFDSLPGFKTGGWANKLTDKLTIGVEKYFGKQSGKIATRILNALGEGSEEVISNFLNMSGTYLYDRFEKALGNEKGFEYGMQQYSGNYGQDLLNMLTSSDTWEEFFSAALATVLTSGGRDAVTNVKYNNAINTYAQQNNVSVEQAKADFNKILNYAVEENKTDKMNRNEVYELEDSLKRQLSKEVKRGLNLSDAALNVDRTMMEKQANLPIIRNTFEESLVNHGFNPNNEVWQSISKALEKRGITGIVDEQYFNDNSENALIINDGNGNRIMAFNPNADTNTIIQANTVHELVHDLIASENSKRKLLGIKAGEEIKDSDIIKYFEKLDGYAEARADLEKTYSTIKDANGNLMYDPKSEEFSKMIDEEVVAKVLEKNLGTQETINRLVHENRNLAQRIYDWIMNKIKNRGGVIRDEELYWRNIQNRFVKAFNMEYNNTNEANTRLSKTTDYISNKKYKTKLLDSAVFEKSVRTKETNFLVNDANYYYIIDNAIDGNYDIAKRIKIEGNEEYIKALDKLRGDYNVDRNRTNYSENIEETTNRLGLNSRDNANVEGEQSWTEFINSVLKEHRQESINNEQYSKESSTNNRELDNSSFNLPLDSKKYSKESKEFDNFVNVTQDNQGRTLTKEQQEFFKDESPELLDEKGRLKEFYHGTPDTNFNVFEPNKMNSGARLKGLTAKGYYFTDNSNFANEFVIPRGKEGETPGVKKVYLKMTNPFVLDTTSNETLQQIRDTFGFRKNKKISLYEISNYINKMVFDDTYLIKSEEHRKAFLEKNGYDGIILKMPNGHNEYVVFNSNQIKDVNNKKPTSNSDIRMSKESKAFDEFLNKNLKDTGTTGDLMAIHNLNEKKLRGILDLGGFPVPSIAITKTDNVGSNQFGDISILFDKSTIDPANRKNEVYDRDVWTPTFPRVEYDVDNSELRKFAKDNNIYEDTNDEIINSARNHYLYSENIADVINNYGIDGLLEKMKKDNELKYLFLKTKDSNYQPQMKPAKYSRDYDNQTLKNYVDMYNNNEFNDMSLPDFYYHYLNYQDMELTQDQKDALKATVRDFVYKEAKQKATEKYNEYKENGHDFGDTSKEKFIDGYTDLLMQKYDESYWKWQEFIRDATKLDEYGERQVIDTNNTLKQVEQDVSQTQFENWVDDTFGKMLNKLEKGIRNDVDLFTPSGYRRDFDKLHDKYTLENVVKLMTKQKTVAGEEGFGAGSGFGTLQAQMSNRFNSIDEIRDYANERIVPGNQEKDLLKPYEDKIYSDMEDLVEYYKHKDSKYNFPMDTVGYALNEYAGKNKQDLTTLKKVLNEYDFNTESIPSDFLNKIVDDINSLKDIPTDYFEAKPQRAVGLDEVQAVVIPNTASEELRKQLNDAGFDFVEYDPNVEGDRQRVINKFDNLKFNKNSPEWNAFVNKHTTTKGTRTKLGDTKLPMAEMNLPIEKIYEQPTIQKYEEQKAKQQTPKTYQLPIVESKKTTMPLKKIDDVLKVSNDISKQINETGDFKLRSWAETSTESDILKDIVYIEDLDPGKITYEVQSNKKSLDTANKHIDTYGYEKSLQDAKSIIRSDKLPTASDVALMQRMIQEAAKRGDTEAVQDLIMETAIVGTDLGQATQALSIIQRLTPEGQLKLYTKLVQRAKARGEKSFKNVEITPEMVQKILEVYNQDGTYDQNKLNEKVEEFKQDIAKQMNTTTMEKLDAWRYLAMLGNPKTHIRNMISNVAMKGTLKVKNAVARTLETILPVKERTKTWRNATPEIKQYAKNTAIEMKDIIQGKAKYNEKSQLEAEKQIFKSKALEKVRNANSNALEFEDWLFSKSAFIKTFQEYLTANNIRTKEDIRNNPKLVQKAKNYAVEQAEIATFRQYSKIASMIGKIERSNKGAKFIIGATLPFKKTPINVAKTGLSYSPLGLFKNMTYDTYRLIKGDINASQYIDNLSQGMTGSTLTLLGYALAKAGFLSGSGDDDKEGKYDSQLGNSQYSINIGGKSYSISWLSPVAMPLLVGANAYEQLEEQKDWDMNVVSDTLAKTLDPLNEMSFLQGLTNALQSYGSGMDKLKGSLESISQNYIGQFFPTLFSQIASVTDDKKRSTKASNNSSYKFGEQTLRSIMYKLPIARQQLEVATDVWGNEKLQSDNIVERAFESFIAPYSKTEHISTDLDNELKKVYNETGENKVLPTVPYGYIKYKDETYRMSASEFTEFKKDYGQTANKMLNNLINTQTYKNASYEEKADMIDEMYEYAREKAKQNYFNDKDVKYESKKLDSYKKIEYITSYDKYIGYKGQIDEIKKKYKSTDDMTSKQKTAMNKKRKEEVQKYINSLSLNRQQKLMLQKFAGGYSVKDYKKELQNYINSLKISKAEKEALDKELFG